MPPALLEETLPTLATMSGLVPRQPNACCAESEEGAGAGLILHGPDLHAQQLWNNGPSTNSTNSQLPKIGLTTDPLHVHGEKT